MQGAFESLKAGSAQKKERNTGKNSPSNFFFRH
jgi:hypothetical protein